MAFQYQRIVEYFHEIPAVSFTYTGGVDSAPDLHVESSEDEAEVESADDWGLTAVPEMSFHDLVRKAVFRAIDKGQQFLSSKRVLCVWDCRRGGHYFIKAQVQASMESVLYVVILTLSSETGAVCDAVYAAVKLGL